MSKYWIAVILLVVMGTTIALIDRRSSGYAASGYQASSRSGPIYATGLVEGATQDIELWFETAGRVTEVLVQAGDWVEQGTVLIRQDSGARRHEVALASAHLDLAKAELEQVRNGARPEEREEARALYRAAQARYQQAEQAWGRIDQLRLERAISQQEADDHFSRMNALRAEVEAAHARVRQLEAPARIDHLRAAEARVSAAQARLRLAENCFAKCALVAPCRGQVLDVSVEPGELSGPDARLPAVWLVDTSTPRVRAFVEELDAPRVYVGTAANITADGLPNNTFAARVVSISPRMSAKTIHADRPGELYDTKVREVLLELIDGEQLIVGLRVDVLIDAPNRKVGSPSHD